MGGVFSIFKILKIRVTLYLSLKLYLCFLKKKKKRKEKETPFAFPLSLQSCEISPSHAWPQIIINHGSSIVNGSLLNGVCSALSVCRALCQAPHVNHLI